MSRYQRCLGNTLTIDLVVAVKTMSLINLNRLANKHRCNSITSESALRTSGHARSSRILSQTIIIYVRFLVTSHDPILILLPGFAPSELFTIVLNQLFVTMISSYNILILNIGNKFNNYCKYSDGMLILFAICNTIA